MKRSMVFAAVGAALLAVAGCGGHADAGEAAATPPQATAPTTAPASPTAEPPESPSPSPSPSPTPAWTPCDPEAAFDDWENECDDFDPCDFAYVASRDGKAAVVDAFIEHIDYGNPQEYKERLKDCPQYLPAWRKAQHGFTDGSYEVGKEVQPGTYETTAHLSGGRVGNCYWERTGKNGRIIANDFVTAARKIRVTIRRSDHFFTSDGCGNWLRVD